MTKHLRTVCRNPHNISDRPGADLGLQHSGGYTTTDVFTGENLGSVLPDHQMDLMVNPNGKLATQNPSLDFFCTIVVGGPIIWPGNEQVYITENIWLPGVRLIRFNVKATEAKLTTESLTEIKVTQDNNTTEAEHQVDVELSGKTGWLGYDDEFWLILTGNTIGIKFMVLNISKDDRDSVIQDIE